MDVLQKLDKIKRQLGIAQRSICNHEEPVIQLSQVNPVLAVRLASLQNLCRKLNISLTNDDSIVRMNIGNSRRDDDSARWVTLENGSRVQLGDDGTIKKGMGGKFNGQTMGEAFGDDCTYYYDGDPANTPCKPGDPLPESLRNETEEPTLNVISGTPEPFPKGIMSGEKLARFHEKQGFKLKNIEGSHHIYEYPPTGRIVSIPIHGNRDIAKPTMSKLKREYNKAIGG